MGVLDGDVVRDLQRHVSMVQMPALERLPIDQLQHYTTGLHNFVTTLEEVTQGAELTVKLSKPPEVHEWCEKQRIARGRRRKPAASVSSKVMVMTLSSMLVKWCAQLQQLVDSGDDQPAELATGGPMSELAFWRRRGADCDGALQQLADELNRPVLELLAREVPAAVSRELCARAASRGCAGGGPEFSDSAVTRVMG